MMKMHAIGRRQRHAASFCQPLAPLQLALVVRPSMQLNQQIAAIGERFLIAKQGFRRRFANHAGKETRGIRGQIIE